MQCPAHSVCCARSPVTAARTTVSPQVSLPKRVGHGHLQGSVGSPVRHGFPPVSRAPWYPLSHRDCSFSVLFAVLSGDLMQQVPGAGGQPGGREGPKDISSAFISGLPLRRPLGPSACLERPGVAPFHQDRSPFTIYLRSPCCPNTEADLLSRRLWAAHAHWPSCPHACAPTAPIPRPNLEKG